MSNWKDITIRLDNYSYDSEKANLKIFLFNHMMQNSFIGESIGKSTLLKIIMTVDVDNIKITIDENKVADERILENLTL